MSMQSTSTARSWAISLLPVVNRVATRRFLTRWCSTWNTLEAAVAGHDGPRSEGPGQPPPVIACRLNDWRNERNDTLESLDIDDQ
jgi:hypothetical protein